jgi:carbon-monoxide dehydrogenase large subunit
MGSNAFGQPVRRREDPRLLCGQGRFIADLVPAGALHAVMIRSPHAHARIVGINTEAARAVPGMRAILTGADIAASGLGTLPAGSPLSRFPGTPPDQGFRLRPPHPLLARDIVRFVGDSVAMVIGDTLEDAIGAAELVQVEYEPLPCVTDTDQAIGGAVVWDAAADNICFDWQAGDREGVEVAFQTAAHVARVRLVNNRIHVASLENRGAIGSYDAQTGRFTLQTGTQMPHSVRDALADDVFRVPHDAVRVLVADVGGSFGIKNAVYREQALVLHAARLLGRDVAWIGGRNDSFLSDYQARDNVSDAELAMDAAGNFLALRVRTLSAIGAYLAPKGQLSPTSNTPVLAGVYRLPFIHVNVIGVFTHTAPTEVYRGAGRPEGVHLLERLVDAAAQMLGRDPVGLRRQNLLPPEAMPITTALGLRYDSGDFPSLLAEAELRADIAGFPARRAAAEAQGLRRGLGMAQYCERVSGAWSEHGWVELRPDGRFTLLTGTMSNGQGHETAFAQLIALRLGVDPAEIDVVQGDTDRIPSGHGTGGSASIGIGGAALDAAAGDLIARARPHAAEALEAAEVDIEFDAGRFSIAGTDRSIGWVPLAARLETALQGTALYVPQNHTFPNGCHVAEVELDPETGHWTVASYIMVHDFGRVLNPMLLEGQLQGGVAQGIGQAAFERVVHDADGQVLTGSFMDYQIPRADELPNFVFHSRPTPSPVNPLGIKGCGEAGAAGGCPAVMNALGDALGVLDVQMPATPETVWRKIRG